VPERHDDLGLRGAHPEELDDLAPQHRRGIAGERRDPLGVEEDHPRPGDLFRAAVGAAQIHHEEVALVVEGVLRVLPAGQRLAAELLEESEMLLASLERLLHRDHPVPEHSSLGHE
jgi:hypothetical protein